MNTDNSFKQQLADHLLNATSREQMDERLQQLLTQTEYEEVCKRLQILVLLKQGVPQRKIAEQLGVGIATVSRGARALKESD
ncbi:Trp family transcriptional regulator [Reinekea marinisedimentorum]|uniref:TrpR family trp operon transcriptional repressor n=1 Tax=Reinekea marinisedimentorum TaxID=230495 RepID=A0A4R3HV57_9GAMM|nr:Trp family transcriptional regulator [Reinekea marinisedimentorum]TCS35935.1 TrpR family trp operon transcriptional repressor [Reinekea marinisedimentorum]